MKQKGKAMINAGPSRFILINSAKYSYGDVVVNKPVQFIGANNIGKTSLINALQFLLIDDEKQMSFPRTMPLTRKYYFPDVFSYILLEIYTPVGIKILGARGQGPVKSYAFERFSYNGEFLKADFIDDKNTVLPFERVQENLVTKNFITLEPRHLKAALTGVGDNKGVSLNLVPLKDSNHYSSFQSVFKNLLHLNNLRQDELKEVILDVYKNQFSIDSIDLSQSYSERFRQIKNDKNECNLLEQSKDEIQRLAQSLEEMNQLTGQLPSIYSEILIKFNYQDEETCKLISGYDIQREEDSNSLFFLKEEKKNLQNKKDECNRALGAIDSFLNKFEELDSIFRSFTPDLEKGALNCKKDRVNELVALLKNACSDDPTIIKKKIKKLEREEKEHDNLLTKSAQLFVTFLKSHFYDTDLENLFRFLNNKLLGLVVGDTEITIDDEELLVRHLQDIIACIDEYNYFNTDFVSVSLNATQSEAGIANFSEPKIIRENLRHIRGDLSEMQKRLESAENIAPLKAEKETLEEEIKQLSEKMFHYGQYLEQKKLLSDKQAQKKELGLTLHGIKKSLEDTETNISTTSKGIAELSGKSKDLELKQESLKRQISNLKRPDDSWDVNSFDNLNGNLDLLIEQYEQEYSKRDRLQGDIQSGVYSLAIKFSGKFIENAPEKNLQKMIKEIDSLSKKQEKNEHDWKDLTALFGNSFAEIYKSYNALLAEITKLNRQLAKVSISNLVKLQLKINANAKWLPKIEQIALKQEASLFANHKAQDDIFTKFASLLSEFPKLQLRDLFSLHFYVETTNGKIKYDNLESIESNGTSMTIKILVNLILLRSLFSPKTTFNIPYYLDEATQLSSENLKAILDVSCELGFTPILAATLPVDAANVLYFMQEKAGKIWMNPKYRMDIEKEDAA